MLRHCPDHSVTLELGGRTGVTPTPHQGQGGSHKAEQEKETQKIKKLNQQARPMNGGKPELAPPTECEGEDSNGVCGLPLLRLMPRWFSEALGNRRDGGGPTPYLSSPGARPRGAGCKGETEMWSVYAPLLRNRKFRLLTAGQVTSQLGDFVGYIAVMAILYQLTGSSLLVGTYMGVQALAGLLVGPAAGAVVDRWDRRSIMIFSDLIRAVLVVMLVFVHAAWQVLLVAMFKSVATSLFNPAKTALTPRIVGKEHLPAALSLQQTLQGTVQILGPVLGGLAVGLLEIRGAFAVDAATFLISGLSLLLFRVEPEAAGANGSQPETAGQPDQSRAGWLSGYRQVLANAVFARLALMRGLSLVGVWAINVVLVAYAYETLRAGHFGYGMLTSALGAGAILGSLSSSLLAKRGHPFGRMAAAAGVIATCIVGAGFARFPLLAYALFLGAGVGIGVYNVNFAVLLQTSVPDEYLGRAAAGMQVVDQLIILLSLAAGGVLADAFGVRIVLVIGAVLIGSTGLIAVVTKRIRAAAATPDAPGTAELGLRVKRVGVTVHDQTARCERAGVAAVVDKGENSIIIGYDGNG